jgi:isopentenyl diphosphate isomerase/L-lactate dehydrogenase-like FMN-dependent dehydrogenase
VRLGFDIPPDLPIPYVKGRDASVAMTFAEQVQMSPSITWRDLEWIAEASGMPVVLKGVLTREDAVLAVDHGAAAILVSNHGGRQLDGAPATLDVLPEVVEAVAGRCEVYVDGGIRRGGDVLKALALGARAAFVARAVASGLAVGGESGVRDVLTILRDELETALALLGCASPLEVGRSHVEPTVPYDPPA